MNEHQVQPEPGMVVVDKPIGPTSHDIVAQARRIFHTRRIGHAGTLDPAASGVLLLMVGEASKLSPFLAGKHKCYRAAIAFGKSTNTLDAAGEPTAEMALAPGWLDLREVERALATERERRMQAPPQFSAIKSGGRVAYKVARDGEHLPLEERAVGVREIRLIEHTHESLTVELVVSKGYYVRAFARDIGKSLKVPSHLAALRRLSSGDFQLSEAVPWPPRSPPHLISLIDAARRCLAVAVLSEDGAIRARVGKGLDYDHFAELPELPLDGAPFVWEFDGELIAIGQARDGEFRVVRGFNTPA